MKSPRFEGRVVEPGRLEATTRDAMFRLLGEHFAHLDRSVFEADLADKDEVALLEVQGSLLGFTTLKYLSGPGCNLLFSGDTIVADRARGTSLLARLWLERVLAHLGPTPLYWFLICSGPRTYRFLPTFWREFYPHPAVPTPAEFQTLLDQVARQRYGTRYRDGIIRLAHPAPLRPERAELDRGDPFIAFFSERNAGYRQGDELACLTPLRLDNLTAAGRRMLALVRPGVDMGVPSTARPSPG